MTTRYPHLCLKLGIGLVLSSPFLGLSAEIPPAPSHVGTFKIAAPSVVTIASMIPFDQDEKKQWESFPAVQRRSLAAARQVFEIDGIWYRYSGHGSGFMIDGVGNLVTNHHVVEIIGSVPDVVFAVCAGESDVWHRAEIVGMDPPTDLAVLRCAETGAKPAVWGDSATLEVGDQVMAIGTPQNLALRQTATLGIVSAIGRGIGSLRYEDFIQTDASINSGNSGGPLVNGKGEVIGVNQSIMLGQVNQSDGTAAESGDGSPLMAGGNIGIGLAVPSAIASRVAQELIEHGRVRRGYLGLRVEEAGRPTAGLPAGGLVVAEVIENGPSASARIQAGDILLEFDGNAVTSMRAFHLSVSMTNPGKKVTLQLLRDGAQVAAEVELGDLSSSRFAVTGFNPGARDVPDIAGVEFQVLKHPELGECVVISRVAPGSPAAKAGLPAPAIVREVAGVPISNPREFLAAASSSVQGGHLLVTVARLTPTAVGRPIEISIPVEK
jgi:serine protease Do